MKNFALVLLLFISHLKGDAQTAAAEFEAVLRSGNSEKAFSFVRKMFNVPYEKDPFLHFKPRGISQLISLYSHLSKRIEATSLIKYPETKKFWTNYSRQFTGGKWNYKQLYKNDSVAWLAANYSISLIYAHETGHYMSYNHFHDYRDDYSCEEVVANQCLAAFAHAFNGNKFFDNQKKLFLELARQTAAAIPDSNKTAFQQPMTEWCKTDPMTPFFDYFEKDSMRFLQLYGYAQFRMMEEAIQNYRGGSFNDFLHTTFLDPFANATGTSSLKPVPYTVLQRKKTNYNKEILYYINSLKKANRNFFNSNFLTDISYHFDPKGELLGSYIQENRMNYDDTLPENNYLAFSLVNRKHGDKWIDELHNLIYADSIINDTDGEESIYRSFEMRSAYQNDSNYYYLIRESESIYNNGNLDSNNYQYRLINLATIGGDHFIRRITLPDSMYKDPRMLDQDIFISGFNNGRPVLVQNLLTEEHRHIINIYALDPETLQPGGIVFQWINPDKGYINMRYPSLFIDQAQQLIVLAFWNPVTYDIVFLNIKEKGNEIVRLYEKKTGNGYGPMMEVMGLRLMATNKIAAYIRTRLAGNASTLVMQKLILQLK